MAKAPADMTDAELAEPTDPLSNQKHCELLSAGARVGGDAMRDGFKLFVQLMSAIVGGAIALRASSSIAPNLQTEIARLAEGFVIFVGFVSALLIADSFRSWWGYRAKLTVEAGKKPDGKTDVVPPLNWKSWITITVMEMVIAACVFAFWFYNPLRLVAA